tara:strand:- start:129 stop:443 length:315 start_codon:yes stop_codon:yes gene_type:complete
MANFKLTCRFVVEKDFKVITRKNWHGSLGSSMMIGDGMVGSGHYFSDVITHESLFDYPMSKWRGIGGHHIHDCNLYVQCCNSGCENLYGETVDPWIVNEMGKLW